VIECAYQGEYCTHKCPNWKACIKENLEARKNYDEEGVAQLIRGVLKWAIKDWASAAGGDTKRRAEQFFLSPYFGRLTGLDGKIVLETMKKEQARRTRRR